LSQYQFTLQADDTSQVLAWTPRLVEALRKCPELTDLNSDQQQNGLQADLKIDRLTMSRFGLLPSAVDNTLYDAFGERQVSTIYNAMNQYAVVMEVAPEYWQNPDTLKSCMSAPQAKLRAVPSPRTRFPALSPAVRTATQGMGAVIQLGIRQRTRLPLEEDQARRAVLR